MKWLDVTEEDIGDLVEGEVQDYGVRPQIFEGEEKEEEVES